VAAADVNAMSSSSVPKLAYRRDIDGLRAVAVVMVVLYHAAPEFVSGGFVGVDIFFVISGFLITSIIAHEVDKGAFSVLRFYERRARRILPVLVVVLASVTAMSLLVSPPFDVREMSKGLASTAAFASNIVFWKETGYFRNEAQEVPLLHTWSLAVEEQFYLSWPLVMAYLFGRKRLRWTLALVVLSFGAAVWHVYDSQPVAFYWPHARAWELLMGALLVFVPPPIISGSKVSLLAAVAAALAVLPGLLYTHVTPFPGLAAVPVCLGTALLIWLRAPRTDVVYRALASKPFVAVGLISYSLYLWHWPALVYGRLLLQRAPSLPEAMALVALSFALAYASWRCVEGPGRHVVSSPRRVLVFSGASLCFFAVAGTVMFKTRGLRFRASAEELAVEASEFDINPLRQNCIIGTGQSEPPREGCTVGRDGPKIVVWGDSHADAIVPGFAELARANGARIEQLAKHSCVPLIGPKAVRINDACAQFNRNVLARLIEDPPRMLVVAGRWLSYLPPAAEGFSADVRATLSRLHKEVAAHTTIVVLGPVPEPGFAVPRCRARALFLGREPNTWCPDLPVAEFQAQSGRVDQALRLASANLGEVRYVAVASALCGSAVCRTTVDGLPAYVDDDHLNVAGARYVVKRLRVSFPDLLAGRFDQ
jgi:peptidoglycan/LPS O-acetylase OafA/YrhL